MEDNALGDYVRYIDYHKIENEKKELDKKLDFLIGGLDLAWIYGEGG